MEVKVEGAVCPWCIHADVLDDICGVYCRIGQENPAGECRFFIDYLDFREEVSEWLSNATWSKSTGVSPLS